MKLKPPHASKLTRTNLVIAAVLLLGFATIAAMYFRTFYDDAMRRMHHEAELELSSIHARLSSLFIQEVTVSTSMAHDDFLISYLSNPRAYAAPDFELVIQKYLQGCMQTYHFDAAFLSLTRNNALYSHKGFDRILSDDAASAWYNAALAHNRNYDINIDTDKFAGEEISIFVNCKIRGREGELLGIIGVCIHTEKIVDAIMDFEQSSGARVSLINEEGNIEIASARKGLERVNWLRLKGNDIFREELMAARLAPVHADKIDFAAANAESGNYVSARYLPELSWFLIVEHPTGNFHDRLWRGALSTALVFLIVLLAVLFVIANVIHSFEREIRGMAEERQRNLASLRDAMVLSLAELVESRDQNTGDHIRKTAAYVRIVLKALRRQKAFRDIIDDGYIRKVVRSAPMHDIGKIKVPDAILNKPGKLTDEEFAIMQTHAAAGGEVIGHILDIVPEAGYLVIARDIARHHHEKWNGKGYPDGLAGEEIPLAARIMAVADVFDALVSQRPYKKAFPIDKAFAIIREESGTHFDPRVVEAFFAAREDIIRVEAEFRSMAA